MSFYASAGSGDPSDSFSLIHPDSHFADAIVVPDADLLIHGTYHRSGLDLVLTGHDGQHHVIAGYFASEHPPALAAPNGAYFSADLVGLLAGSPAPHEYAQAQGQAASPADSIGKIQKIAGDVTVQRNGVSVALNVGDVVYKSDVIVTGADAKCGLTFPDGTALELLPNTRMALNEYDYDAKSTSNQALFTLVEGTFGFVAGKVAHTGDMKIGTPVATMGIRGTTGVVQMVQSTTGEITYSYSVYDDPGTNHSGSWDMFLDNPDGTQTLLATVSQTGYVTFVTSHGLHEPRFVSTVPLSASQVDADQLIIIDLADLAALAGPRSIGIPGSGDNPLLVVPPNLFPELFGNGGTTTYNYQLPPLPGPAQPQNPQNPINPIAASDVFIWPIGNGPWPTGPQWNQGVAPNDAIDIVIIELGVVTYDLTNPVTIYSLTIDGPGQNGGLPQGELQMIGGQLNVTNGLTVAGELFIGNGDPPRFVSYGTSVIESDGQVIANGKGSTVEFLPDPSDPSATSTVVENFGGIRAQDGGIIKFTDSLVTNEPAPASTGDSESKPQPGIIEAAGKGSLVKLKDSIVFNAGLVAAEHGGTVKFVDGSTVNNDPGSVNTDTNAETAPGEIESIGRDSLVLFRHSSLDNFGIVAAEHGGRVEFLHSGTVTNAPETTPLSGGDIASPAGEIKSTGWGSDVSFVHTDLNNFGLVAADCYGAITFCDAKIVNESSLLTGATPAPAGLIEAEDGGFIGVNGGKVVNDTGARIEAEYGGVIDIGWADVTNHKGALIEASDHGTILFEDVAVTNYDKSTDSGAGLIAADGCRATVELANASIDGGTVQSRDGSKIEAIYGANEFLDVTINGGIVQLDGYVSLALEGDTVIDKTVTFEGPGVFKLNGDDSITGGDVGGLLKNQSTIEGSGQIIGTADNPLTLDNGTDGKVDADVAGRMLVLDTGSNTVSNAGTLEATVGGELNLYGTYQNTGGTIGAFSEGVAPALVQLFDATIDGGALLTDANLRDGSMIEVVATGGANESVFDGSDNALTIDAYVKVDAGANLELIGTIHDLGIIDVDSATSGSDLVIDGQVTLNGFGEVTLDGPEDEITGIGCSDPLLENYVNIAGSGTIGGGGLKLINEVTGTIDADGGGFSSLAIHTGEDPITNDGLMEAVSYSVLDIDSRLDNFGNVTAAQGGEIVFDADLLNESGGHVEAIFDGAVTLDDIKVTNDAGALIEADGAFSVVSIACDIVDNYGLTEAENGGSIFLANSFIDNVGGTFAADGPGSVIDLSNVLVSQGNLDTSCGGLIQTVCGVSTLSDVSINGDLAVGSGTTLILDDGTTMDGGVIFVAKGATLDIEASTGATLSGVTIINDGTVDVDCDYDTSSVTLTLNDGSAVFGGKVSIGDRGTLAIGSGGAVFDSVDVDIDPHGNIVVGPSALSLAVDEETQDTKRNSYARRRHQGQRWYAHR